MPRNNYFVQEADRRQKNEIHISTTHTCSLSRNGNNMQMKQVTLTTRLRLKVRTLHALCEIEITHVVTIMAKARPNITLFVAHVIRGSRYINIASLEAHINSTSHRSKLTLIQHRIARGSH